MSIDIKTSSIKLALIVLDINLEEYNSLNLTNLKIKLKSINNCVENIYSMDIIIYYKTHYPFDNVEYIDNNTKKIIINNNSDIVTNCNLDKIKNDHQYTKIFKIYGVDINYKNIYIVNDNFSLNFNNDLKNNGYYFIILFFFAIFYIFYFRTEIY